MPAIFSGGERTSLMSCRSSSSRRTGASSSSAPETSFKAWIFQIATYEIFNLNRKHAREWRLRVPWDEELVDHAGHKMDPLAELEREAAYDLVLRDPELPAQALDAELQSAIASLPPPERSVLLLRIIGEFSTSETAQMLHMPVGSVMGYLGRARRKLRLALADYARAAGRCSWPKVMPRP